MKGVAPNKVNIKQLFHYAVTRLWKSNKEATKRDITIILTTTKEPIAVLLLATYYVMYLKKVSVKMDSRLVYIITMGIAIKYIDDETTIDLKSWANFANISIDQFNELERTTLKHLGYDLDPGQDVMYKLIEKLKSTREKALNC